MTDLPRVSVVVPHLRGYRMLEACLKQIQLITDYPDWRILVVSKTESSDKSEIEKNFANIEIIESKISGFANAINIGINAIGGGDIVRLDSNVLIKDKDWLKKLAVAANTIDKIGIVGARILYPDGRIQSEGRNLISGLGFNDIIRNRKEFEPNYPGSNRVYEVDGVPGSLTYYTRAVINEVGSIDERYGYEWTEDDDYCISARLRGFKVYVHAGVEAIQYTTCWAPTSKIISETTSKLISRVCINGRRTLEKHQAESWLNKWGWNPYYPDLNRIRRLYEKTEICWRIGEPMRFRSSNDCPTVDCCLVTWNNYKLLKRTLDSLSLTNYPAEKIRIYITDNGSTDETKKYLSELENNYKFKLLVEYLPVNTGAPIGLNFAIVRGEGELVARLDDDIILEAEWLQKMIKHFYNRPFTGCVGPKILNDNDFRSIQCAAYRHFPNLYGHEEELDNGQANYLARTTHIRGCCNLYRRDVFKSCGLFDNRFSPSQCDDPDHHIALLVSGFDIIYDGYVSVVHKLNSGVSKSNSGLSNQQGNSLKMYGKWGRDIYQILDRSIDLSDDGRYLSDLPNGENNSIEIWTSNLNRFAALEKAGEEPGRSESLWLSIFGDSLDIDRVVEEFLDAARVVMRLNDYRAASELLHSALNVNPVSVQIYEMMVEVYQLMGQAAIAQAIASTGLLVNPSSSRLKNAALDVCGKNKEVQNCDNTIISKYESIGESNLKQPQIAVNSNPDWRLRVLMVNTFENRLGGGDMVQIKKTKEYLERFRICVDISCTPRPDPEGYDLVHLWNTWFPHQTLAQAKAIKQISPKTPIVLSPIYWNCREKSWADVGVKKIFQSATSSAHLDLMLTALAEDRYTLNGFNRKNAPEANYQGFEQYQRELFKIVDHILPLSHAENICINNEVGVNKPFTVIRNAADISIFEKADSGWFIGRYGIENFVISVGLMEVRKNQLLLLHALKDTGLKVVLVGRSYDGDYLKMCKKVKGVDVTHIEHLPHEMLASAYKAARVFALPSWMECASLANIEAAMSGCALALSNRTSEMEYFGRNAYYCDPADWRSIKVSVLDAFNNFESDANKRLALKKQFSQGFTWENAAIQTIKAYNTVLNRSISV